jgi:TnpA family transposase
LKQPNTQRRYPLLLSALPPLTVPLLSITRADRQNTLAAALTEYGSLRRTIYAARYLARPDYRRKIGRQLNKGESMHALRRDVFYAHEGAIRRRHLQHQNDQAWCLTLAANAITA